MKGKDYQTTLAISILHLTIQVQHSRIYKLNQKSVMDAPRPVVPNPTLSLVARLDHLDLVLNRLEAKHDLTKMGSRSSTEREFLPLNLAVRDAYFKGSVLDRVASLENRLFQLCLEVDSTGSSNQSAHTTDQREVSASRTTVFAIPTPSLSHRRQPVRAELPEIQEEANFAPGRGKEQKKKRCSNTGKKDGKKASGGGKDDNSAAIVRRKGKTRNYSTFMNILGCSI